MLLSVARVSKLFGVEGGVMINLYTTFPDDFSTEEPLFATFDSLAVPLFCDKFERRGASGAVVTFADFDSERRVMELLGKELAMEQDEEPSDEFYMEDLIGFKVTAKGLKGSISNYMDSEVNPLFEVATDSNTVLIPAVEEFIAHIDFEKHTIKFVLPEGLIDLK